MRHSVECIGEHNDASRHWNTAAAKAIRISRPVPPLVVRENARGKVRVEGRNWREHVGATLRVRGYRPPFRGGEMRVLVNDVEERLVNLPNVMEQRHALDDFPSVGTELGGVGDDQGVGGDATHVRTGLCVIRVDRIEQRFQAGGGKSLRRRSTAAFSYEERAARNAGEDDESGSHAEWVGKIRTSGHRDRAGELHAKKKKTNALARYTRAFVNEKPAVAYSPALSRAEYHRRCRA